MEKQNVVPFESKQPSSTETFSDSSRSFGFSSTSDMNKYSGKYPRSKSLSNMSCGGFSTAEMRRMRLRANSHVQPTSIKTFSSHQKLTLLLLALVDFMSFCSMSIMAPFFPKEASEKGLSNTTSGIIFSFYALVMFITAPIFGKILPKFGAKFLFINGICIAGSCNILFGLLEYVENYTLFTTLCIIIRGFEALGASAFSTASYVFVVNMFPQNMGSVLGILETFVGLGMSTGPALGGLLYSFGGFPLPFFVMGIAMLLVVPINIMLLPNVEDCNLTNRSTSLISLIRVPAVIATCSVVIIVSSVWSFLDPTLEPHLRQFNLSPERVGLVFLMFSALYGLSSPAWGWLADKINNHWSMMVVGLFMCTIGLLLLGPCPYLPFLTSSMWLTITALSILGVSVALTLLPTFQGILTSAVDSGCCDSLGTYSVVAGVWSCMYSLGEVIGPSLGGFLLQFYGFPFATTVMASMTFCIALITMTYFLIKSCCCKDSDTVSDSGINESWRLPTDDEYSESTPLILTHIDGTHRTYTENKIQYYEERRRYDKKVGDVDVDQVTDVRGTLSMTGKGSCEV